MPESKYVVQTINDNTTSIIESPQSLSLGKRSDSRINDPYIKTKQVFKLDENDNFEELNINVDSVYGVALIGWSVADLSEYQKPCPFNLQIIWAVFNQCFVMLLVNYIAQYFLLWYLCIFVQKAGGAPFITFSVVEPVPLLSEQTCNVDSTLRYICLSLFLTATLGDMSETIGIIRWMYKLKTEKLHKAIEVSETKSGDVHLTSGFTIPHQIFNIVVIIIPKFLIGLLLMIYGSAFIVLSGSNQDAFLNTLASVFIIEIDELLYNAYSSYVVKNAIKDLPPIKVKVSKYITFFSVMFSNWILMLLCALMIGIVERRYCGEVLLTRNVTDAIQIT